MISETMHGLFLQEYNTKLIITLRIYVCFKWLLLISMQFSNMSHNHTVFGLNYFLHNNT